MPWALCPPGQPWLAFTLRLLNMHLAIQPSRQTGTQTHNWLSSSLISQMTCTNMQEALGFQPSQAAMAAITEASIQRAMARATWREARRRFNLALSASRCQTLPLLGGDTVAAAHIFQRLAKPAEVRAEGLGYGG